MTEPAAEFKARELAEELAKNNTAEDLAWLLARVEGLCVVYPKDWPAEALIERILIILAEGKP